MDVALRQAKKSRALKRCLPVATTRSSSSIRWQMRVSGEAFKCFVVVLGGRKNVVFHAKNWDDERREKRSAEMKGLRKLGKSF